MTPELESAVANAREVFAGYSLNGRITVCNCPSCVAPDVERELIRTPLQQISRTLLAEYTNSAHGWDSRISEDFRYFLPRYFELIALGEIPSNNDLETCLDRMFEADYRTAWPQQEVDAIATFFAALFGTELRKPIVPDRFGLFNAGKSAEAILCCATRAGADVRPLLDVWDKTTTRESTIRIAATIIAADWRPRQLANSGWLFLDRKPVVAAMDTIIAWLMRAETWQRLESACLAETDEMAADLLSQAEGLIARHACGRVPSAMRAAALTNPARRSRRPPGLPRR